MRVILCRCDGAIPISETDWGPDVQIKLHENLCKRRAEIGPDEKLVIAGCSPNMLGRLFPDAHAEFVNVYEHVVLAGHRLSKAKELIQAAVEKLKVTPPVPTCSVPPPSWGLPAPEPL